MARLWIQRELISEEGTQPSKGDTMGSKYVSKRAAQDADRDELASRLDELLPELTMLWDGDGTLEVSTITLSRARTGDGTLAIVKGTVLPDSKNFEVVEQFGGRGVLFYGFGHDAVSALASVEVLLRRGEVSLQVDRFAKREEAPRRATGGRKAPKTHKGD